MRCYVLAVCLALVSYAQSFDLIPKGEGAPKGTVRVSSSGTGLVIEGKVDGPKPARIEVWLSATQQLKLPPIGWGNQFGENDLQSEKDCADQKNEAPNVDVKVCQTWFQQQVHYRAQFKRLFVRQWMFGDKVTETFATEAQKNIKSKQMAPIANDGVAIRQSDGFVIQIPYAAFPPVPSLTVKDLWVMVDVFNKAGGFSSTSANRKWADTTTFNHVTLEKPLEFQLSPCGYPLDQKDNYEVPQPGFVYPLPKDSAPGKKIIIDKVISLFNPASGYLYSPEGASPEADVIRVFSKPTGDGGFVCGPHLAYTKGATSVKTEDLVEEEGFDSKVLPDGFTLVKTGPRADYSRWGSGVCGACARAQLQIYSVSPQGKVEPALSIYEIVGDRTAAADLSFAPDWSRAIYYSQTSDGPWKSTTYCLKGHKYEACGTKENIKPPNPPHVKELNN